jgi:hypothetical protein
VYVEDDDIRTDKHGVVDRLSSVLHASGIDHLFSSSFKTANVLVSFRGLAARFRK